MKEFRELTLHFLNMDTYVDFQKTGGKGVFGRQKLQNHMFKLIRVYLKAVKKQKQKTKKTHLSKCICCFCTLILLLRSNGDFFSSPNKKN